MSICNALDLYINFKDDNYFKSSFFYLNCDCE